MTKLDIYNMVVGGLILGGLGLFLYFAITPRTWRESGE